MVRGAPQAHGKVGGVKAFSRRHVGQRTGTLSAMFGSWRVGRFITAHGLPERVVRAAKRAESDTGPGAP
ncbi:hypothetical protein GCM10010361_71710 [Streptomyces olivaceiscleroticus]|uniref:Uncharacterized protein n=1 Tax=Streptomyces olivaceiscleroticus TaxID=68245 RepID=A0ABN1BEK6_9ACTN